MSSQIVILPNNRLTFIVSVYTKINGDNEHEKSRYTEEQIIKILREVEAGRMVKDVCHEYGVALPTYYNWKSKYGAWKHLM
ncbi:hypothetical protein VEZ01S_49_00120 [Vibrio ezurae NBRC 102218]|uniref:Transposase n=1 Tax=Vibrio ezurae NBRC 102218 TaxID=1219080 RepID=U3CIR2_9VIBR|nr:hypothetical protein VEZ01S_49_00120 [Vibrio ezurae NBRC 102218]